MRLNVGLLNLALALGCCLPDQCDDLQTRSCVGAFDGVCETALWDTQCIEEAKASCNLRCGCQSSTDGSVLASLRSLTLDDNLLEDDNLFVSASFSASPRLEDDMGSNLTAGVTAGAEMFRAVWHFLNAGAGDTGQMATLHFMEDVGSSTIAATVSQQGLVTRLITFHLDEQGLRLERASYLGFPAPYTLTSQSFEQIGRKYVQDFAAIPEASRHKALLLLRGKLGLSTWPSPVAVPAAGEEDGCGVRIEHMMAVVLASIVPAGVSVLDAARAMLNHSPHGEYNKDLATKVQALATHFLEDEALQQSDEERITAAINAEEEVLSHLRSLIGVEGIVASFQPTLSPEQFNILKIAIPLGFTFAEWSRGSSKLPNFRVLADFNEIVARAFAVNRGCPVLKVANLDEHHLKSLLSKTMRGILQEQIDKHAPTHLSLTVDDLLTGLHEKLRSNNITSTTATEEEEDYGNVLARRSERSFGDGDVCSGFTTRLIVDLFNIVLAGLLSVFRAVMVYKGLAEMTTPIWRVISTMLQREDGIREATVGFIQFIGTPATVSQLMNVVSTALAGRWYDWLLLGAEIVATIAALVCSGGASVAANIALVGVAVGFLAKDIIEYKEAACTIEKPSGDYCYCDYPMDFSTGKNGFTCAGEATQAYCPLNTYCNSYELFQFKAGQLAPCSSEPVCICTTSSMHWQGKYTCSDGTEGSCQTPGDQASVCWNGQYCDRKGNQNCGYPVGMSFPKANLKGHCLKQASTDVNSDSDYCQCAMPGSVSQNQYTCMDGKTQYCSSNQYCLGIYPWIRKDTNANRCTEGGPRVTCKCDEPGNSEAYKNGYKCSDGSQHYCSDAGVSCNGMDFWLLNDPPCEGECFGVSYNAAIKSCYTKHYTCDNPSQSAEWSFYRKSGYLAMESDCSGNDLGSTKLPSWAKCKTHCDGNADCVGFTYFVSPAGGAGENVCYPKSAECYSTGVPIVEGKCASSPACHYKKQAGAYTNMYGDCFGHDMRAYSADTLATCLSFCNSS